MDILDIDEALKDDSFIFLEDKTHDDISNILQQWKSNSYLPPPSSTTAQAQQQDQAYKLDSRTFTRPKRKSAQNLDLQFKNTANISQQHPFHQQQQHLDGISSQADNPMLNLEIGGLVTNMHKSFLHDTSPPSFSSMDASIERMNNSLITSADFSNINFLQSTNSIDFGGSEINRHRDEFNLIGKITNDGYTLSDMIRDRKALESLTMSSEETLIKDSQIGLIDDISLALSKTASGCSTMDNSTESVEANNRTVDIRNSDRTFDNSGFKGNESNNESSCDRPLNRTMVLTDEMIGDITYNLVENSLYASMTSDKVAANGRSYNINHPDLAQEETVCISNKGVLCEKNNSTFDCQLNITPNDRCETPEAVEKTSSVMKFHESTPQASSVPYNKHYTPTLKMMEDANISPIIASSSVLPHNETRTFNDTFEHDRRKDKANIVNTQTFSGNLPLNATVEMIENIENPNKTFDQHFRLYEGHRQASLEMKNVMDLAQAEANLLASNNNEDEFDHMLDEFSKVELNAEQLKMKKSLDSIKKRFSYGSNKDKTLQREISREAKDMREMLRASADLLGDEDVLGKDYLHMTVEINAVKADVKPSKEHLIEPLHASNGAVEGMKSSLKDSVTSSSSITESKLLSNGLSMSSASSASNGGERLLSRRSRLYDDFNISTISPSSAHATRTPLNSSYTVNKDEESKGDDIDANVINETENVCGQNAPEMVQEKTESTADKSNGAEQATCNLQETATTAAQYRLAEKRERDRDRFKTIKISKNRSGIGHSEVGGMELNVPCIDDNDADVKDYIAGRDDQQTNERSSRRDQTVSPIFNNNKAEVEIVNTNKTNTKLNPNYLTYKKPKEKLANVRNLPEISPASTNIIADASEVTSNIAKPRSLSRPRYLSGLTKFSAVSKATSADELEKSVPCQTNQNAVMLALSSGISKGSSAINVSQNRTQIPDETNHPSTADLKSPMGIKSKSFHNLSRNHALSSNSNVGHGIPAPKTLGLRKPSAPSTEKYVKSNPIRYSSINNTSNSQQPSIQKSDEGLFKVPKLVSGLRAPAAGTSVGGSKRAGLVRPSSGYFSLNISAKGAQPGNVDVDSDNGRHSPTDSMSSASSRGSAQNVNKPVGLKAPQVNSTPTKINGNVATALTKITISGTGIPKPSGIRPPSSIKRSGLPRPSSFVRADK